MTYFFFFYRYIDKFRLIRLKEVMFGNFIILGCSFTFIVKFVMDNETTCYRKIHKFSKSKKIKEFRLRN